MTHTAPTNIIEDPSFSNPATDTNSDLAEAVRVKVEPPKKWKVILHNDDKTTFEFVIAVLTQIFRLDPEKAFMLTTQIHEEGCGVAGLYTHEIAEAKTEETLTAAQQNGYPLIASAEEE